MVSPKVFLDLQSIISHYLPEMVMITPTIDITQQFNRLPTLCDVMLIHPHHELNALSRQNACQ